MDSLVTTLLQYCSDPNFTLFQNDTAEKMYKTLSHSYSKKANEVEMVSNLCDNISGTNYRKIKFYAKKIHGRASYVKFYNPLNIKNSNPTKELADMVVISIATSKDHILFEKIAFIQNKKDVSQSWNIDQDQLFLLHNFPTFEVTSGKLKNMWKGKTALNNIFGQLGNYGLFLSPGEMLFLNARLISMVQDKGTVSFDNIKRANIKSPACMNFFDPFGPFCMPILSSCEFASNIYEFVKNWTLFNIGEPAIVDDKELDDNLIRASSYFLKAVGFSDPYINLDDLDLPLIDFESDTGIFVMHISLDSAE